jgi:AraC-like DNA-binding protein
MRASFEKVVVPGDASWTLFHRQLDSFPFIWHYHPEFELTLTLNSRGQRFIGDHIASYEDGDLVLVGPDLPHTWCSRERLRADRPHEALVAWFSQAWADRLTEAWPELGELRRLLTESARGVAFSAEPAAAARRRLADLPALDPAQRLARLIEVLVLLAGDRGRRLLSSPAMATPADSSRGPDRERIDRVLSHLNRHYREPVDIAALAAIAHLSPSAFHRFFKRHTRMTVGDYVTQLRIGQACALLINTGRPVAIVADEVGYPNIANFNRQFRRLKRMTPRAFRGSFANGRSATGNGSM